ncbi:META domain-containing protein [Orrella sp. JC864]|uniref:META domain-containing protein n=1 Tax=Orrella sp. JC864 TaxID=3120298 RepID=UPI00300A9334
MHRSSWRSLAGSATLSLAVLALAGCAAQPRAGAPAASQEDPLVQTEWRLTQWTLPGGAARLLPRGPQARPLTLAFSREGGEPRASGFAGCNRYTAGYVYAHGLLIVQAPVSTRMACLSPELSRLEGDYLQALTRIASSTLDAQSGQRYLTVTTTGGDTLRFER